MSFAEIFGKAGLSESKILRQKEGGASKEHKEGQFGWRVKNKKGN